MGDDDDDMVKKDASLSSSSSFGAPQFFQLAQNWTVKSSLCVPYTDDFFLQDERHLFQYKKGDIWTKKSKDVLRMFRLSPRYSLSSVPT